MSGAWTLSEEERRQAEPKATRAAYGESLIEMVEAGMDIMAVDADLSGSTTTKKFAEAYPDRFTNVGIAEQNMIGVASGLALSGSTVFTGSFAVFGTGRDYEQIRNTVCASNLNVKIAPTHSGVSVGADGGSHQMLEDIALMRACPGMRVLVPADYAAAKSCLKYAASMPGPYYIRLGRAKYPRIYSDSFKVKNGGSQILRMGEDVTICACGYEVHEAIKAADVLAEEGISAEVIDVYSVKPLDLPTLTRSIRNTGHVVTCEEHSIIGGLGSAIAELLSTRCPVWMDMVGVKDRFGQSGTFPELLTAYELDCDAIVEAVDTLL